MDCDTGDLNESMVNLIERAEAYLTAHETLLNRSSRSMFESSVEEQKSFTAEESPGSSRQGVSVSGFVESSSSGPTSDTQTSQAVELLTDDELNDSNSTIPYEVDLPEAVPYVPPPPTDADTDDCVFVSCVQIPTIDLCSAAFEDESEPQETPRTRQNRLRRAVASAPIVDLITLDDTIAEQLEQPQTRRRQQPVAIHTIEDTQPDNSPVVKRTKNTEPNLDLSQSSDGGETSRSVVCPICYDSIFKKQASSTVCGHLFCYACIKQEIQLRQKCPLCKRKLGRSQVHPIYFS